MATKKVLVEINVEQKGNSIPNTTKEVDKLAKATERLAKEQSEEAIELAKVNYQIKQQQAANKLLAKEQIDLANTVEHTTGAMQEMKTTSGLTGAIVTELGRTASDSAYGIRGMGNNISQLVTLFGQLSTNVTKAGGTMKDALNQVFQSMKGVIGIMTAIQVVLGLLQAEWFQKWISGLLRMTGLMDLFSSELSKLKSGIEEVTDEFGGLITELEVYTEILESSTRSVEDKEKAYKKIIDKFPEMEDSIKRVGNEFVISAGAVDAMTSSLEELSVSAAALERLKELRKDLLKQDLAQKISNDEVNTSLDDNIKRLKEIGVLNNRSAGQLRYYRDQIQDATTSEKDRYIAMSRSSEILEEGQKQIGIYSGEVDEYESSMNDLRLSTEDYAAANLKTIKNTEKEIELLKEYIKLDEDPKKDPLERRGSNTPLKAFRKGLLLLNKEEAGFLKERENLNRRTAEQIITDEQEQREILIDIRLEEFKDSQKIRLDTYLSTKKLTDKQKEDAKRDYEESIELAEQEAEGVIRAIRSVADEKQKIREQDQELDKKERENRISELEKEIFLSRQVNVVDTVIQQGELDMLLLDNRRNLLEAELELETENTERKKELINQLALLEMQQQDQSYVNAENVSNAKLALATRGANVIADIIGKETAAGKTVAATAATVNTYQAVSNSLKYGTSPYKYVDAGITAAYGFQQVRNILNTDSPNTGSGGTGGSNVTVQPPDFNIVGSTGVNQLADAIGSTETPVVKAVVVASEVTTQQALDRNNRTNAEL